MSQLHNGYSEFEFAYPQDLSPDLDGVIFSAASDDVLNRDPVRCCKLMEGP